jgi:hypothetical protein
MLIPSSWKKPINTFRQQRNDEVLITQMASVILNLCTLQLMAVIAETCSEM